MIGQGMRDETGVDCRAADHRHAETLHNRCTTMQNYCGECIGEGSIKMRATNGNAVS